MFVIWIYINSLHFQKAYLYGNHSYGIQNRPSGPNVKRGKNFSSCQRQIQFMFTHIRVKRWRFKSTYFFRSPKSFRLKRCWMSMLQKMGFSESNTFFHLKRKNLLFFLCITVWTLFSQWRKSKLPKFKTNRGLHFKVGNDLCMYTLNIILHVSLYVCKRTYKLKQILGVGN